MLLQLYIDIQIILSMIMNCDIHSFKNENIVLY
mgnify:CR=1 FL=1